MAIMTGAQLSKLRNKAVKPALKGKRSVPKTVTPKVDEKALELQKLEQQKSLYLDWLTDTLVEAQKKGRRLDFISDMKARLVGGRTLTDNQEAAVVKWQLRDAEYKKEKENPKPFKEYKVTLKIRPFLMKDLKIDSRLISGTVIAETAKAWKIVGYADMLINMCWCCRCGRELTEPASQTTGMGAICAGKAGIEYDPKDVLNASKKERAKIRKSFKEKLNQQKFERWIPKSAAEIYQPEE